MTDEAKALVEWFDKTKWVQDSVQPHELGLHRADVLRNRIETQAREIERLREALGWYEKQASDCRKITREGDDARYALDRDGGERARAALAGDSHDQ